MNGLSIQGRNIVSKDKSVSNEVISVSIKLSERTHLSNLNLISYIYTNYCKSLWTKSRFVSLIPSSSKTGTGRSSRGLQRNCLVSAKEEKTNESHSLTSLMCQCVLSTNSAGITNMRGEAANTTRAAKSQLLQAPRGTWCICEEVCSL